MMGGRYPERSEMRLVLVGKSGAGKSATANTILGEKKFDSKSCSASSDKNCRKETVNWKGTDVAVVDTPGFFDIELPQGKIFDDICKCITMTQPGPHAIVLVIRIGRYTEEERKTIERIQDTFGEQAARYMIVMFTRKDDLEDVSIHDYLSHSGSRELQQLIQMCGKRYCAFNNRAATKEREEQVNELLTMIDGMVEQNNGTCYTKEMYQQADKMLQEKKEAQKAQQKDPLEEERKKLERQFEEEAAMLKRKAKAREDEMREEFKRRKIPEHVLENKNDHRNELQHGSKRTTENTRVKTYSQSYPGRIRPDKQNELPDMGQIYGEGQTTQNKRQQNISHSFPQRKRLEPKEGQQDDIIASYGQDTPRGIPVRGGIEKKHKEVFCFGRKNSNRAKKGKKKNNDFKKAEENNQGFFAWIRRLFRK